ncbi:hypothetical protein VaNZ11_008606, partial [Volvox africanus]
PILAALFICFHPILYCGVKGRLDNTRLSNDILEYGINSDSSFLKHSPCLELPIGVWAGVSGSVRACERTCIKFAQNLTYQPADVVQGATERLQAEPWQLMLMSLDFIIDEPSIFLQSLLGPPLVASAVQRRTRPVQDGATMVSRAGEQQHAPKPIPQRIPVLPSPLEYLPQELQQQQKEEEEEEEDYRHLGESNLGESSTRTPWPRLTRGPQLEKAVVEAAKATAPVGILQLSSCRVLLAIEGDLPCGALQASCRAAATLAAKFGHLGGVRKDGTDVPGDTVGDPDQSHTYQSRLDQSDPDQVKSQDGSFTAAESSCIRTVEVRIRDSVVRLRAVHSNLNGDGSLDGGVDGDKGEDEFPGAGWAWEHVVPPTRAELGVTYKAEKAAVASAAVGTVVAGAANKAIGSGANADAQAGPRDAGGAPTTHPMTAESMTGAVVLSSRPVVTASLSTAKPQSMTEGEMVKAALEVEVRLRRHTFLCGSPAALAAELSYMETRSPLLLPYSGQLRQNAMVLRSERQAAQFRFRGHGNSDGGQRKSIHRSSIRSSRIMTATAPYSLSRTTEPAAAILGRVQGTTGNGSGGYNKGGVIAQEKITGSTAATATSNMTIGAAASASVAAMVAMLLACVFWGRRRHQARCARNDASATQGQASPSMASTLEAVDTIAAMVSAQTSMETLVAQRGAQRDDISQPDLTEAPLELLATITDTISDAGGAFGGGGGGVAITATVGGTGTATGTGTGISTGTDTGTGRGAGRRVLAGALAGMHLAIPRISSIESNSPREAADSQSCGLRAALTDGAWSPGGSSWAALAAAVSDPLSPPPLLFGAKAGPGALANTGAGVSVEAGVIFAGPTAGLAAAAGPVPGLFRPHGPAEGMLPTQDIPECPEEEERQAGANGSDDIIKTSEATRTSAVHSGVGGIGFSDGYGGQVRSCLSGLVHTVGSGVDAAAAASATVTETEGRGSGGAAGAIISGETWQNSSGPGIGGTGVFAQAYTSGRGGDGSGMLDRIWHMQEALLAAPALESSGGLVAARDVIIDMSCILGRGSYAMTCKGRWRGADVAVKVIMYDRGTSRKLQSELLPCGATSHPNVIGTLLHFYVQIPPSFQLPASTSTHFARSGTNTTSQAAGAPQVFQVSKLDPPVPDAASSELMYRFSSNTVFNRMPYSYTLDASVSGLPGLGLGSSCLSLPRRGQGIPRPEASRGELSAGGADGLGAADQPTTAEGPRKLYDETLPAAVFSTSTAMSAHYRSENDPGYSPSAVMTSSVWQLRSFATQGRLAAAARGPFHSPNSAAAASSGLRSSGLRVTSPLTGEGRQATHEVGRTNDTWELPLLSRVQPSTEDSSGRPRRDPTLLEKFTALLATNSNGAAAAAAVPTGTGRTDDVSASAKAVDLPAAVSVAPGRPLDRVPQPHPHQSPLAAAVVTARSPAVTGDRVPSALALPMDSSSGRHEDITLGLEVSELPSHLPLPPQPARACDALVSPLTLSPAPRTVRASSNAAAITAITTTVTAKSATAIATAASELAVSTATGSTPGSGWPDIGPTTATAGGQSGTVQVTNSNPQCSRSSRIVPQAMRPLDPHIPLPCRTGGGGSIGDGVCSAVTGNARCPSLQSLLQSPFMLQTPRSPLPPSPRAAAIPMQTHGLNRPVGSSATPGPPEAAPCIPPQATSVMAMQASSGRHLVKPSIWVGSDGGRSSGGDSGLDGSGKHRRQFDFGSIIKSVPLQPLGGPGAAGALSDSINSSLVGFETAGTFSGLHGISVAAAMSGSGMAGLTLLQPKCTTTYETQLEPGVANAVASSGITPSVINSAYSLLMAMTSERDSSSSGIGMGLPGTVSVGTSKLGLDEFLERMATASSTNSSQVGPTASDAAAAAVAAVAAMSQGSNPMHSCVIIPPQSISSPSPQLEVEPGCGLFASSGMSTTLTPTDSANTAASASSAGPSAATRHASASAAAAETVLRAAGSTAAVAHSKLEVLANLGERCCGKVDRSGINGSGGSSSGSVSAAPPCRGTSLAILPSATAGIISTAACGSSTGCTGCRNVTVGSDNGQIDRLESGIECGLSDEAENCVDRGLGPGSGTSTRGGVHLMEEQEGLEQGEHPPNVAVEPVAQTTAGAPTTANLDPPQLCVPTGPPLPDGVSFPASEASGGSSLMTTAALLPLMAMTPAVAMQTSAARMLKHGRQRRSHSFHHRSGASRPRSRLCLQTVGEVLLSQAATEPVPYGSPAASSRRRWSSLCPFICNLADGSHDSAGGDGDVASDDFGAAVGDCAVNCGDDGDENDIHAAPTATLGFCAGSGLVSECRLQSDSSFSAGANSKAKYVRGGATMLDIRPEHSSSKFIVDEDDLGGTFPGLVGNIGGSGDAAAGTSVATLSGAAGPLDLADANDSCNRRTDARPGNSDSRTTAMAAAQPIAAATKGADASYQPPLRGAGGSTFPSSAAAVAGQRLMVMNLGRSRTAPPDESKPVSPVPSGTYGSSGTQEHHSAPQLTSMGDMPLISDVPSQCNYKMRMLVAVEPLPPPLPAVPAEKMVRVITPVSLSFPAQPQSQPSLGTSGRLESEVGLNNLAAVSPVSFDPWKSGNSVHFSAQASVGSHAVIGAGGGCVGSVSIFRGSGHSAMCQLPSGSSKVIISNAAATGAAVAPPSITLPEQVPSAKVCASGSGGRGGTAAAPDVTRVPGPACPAAAPAPAPTSIPEAFCATDAGASGEDSVSTNITFRKPSSGVGLLGIPSDGHTVGSQEMASTANNGFGVGDEGCNSGHGLPLYTLLTNATAPMTTEHPNRCSASPPHKPDSNGDCGGPFAAGSEILSSPKRPDDVVVHALTGIPLHQEKTRSNRCNISGSGGSHSHRLPLLPPEVATATVTNAAGGRSASAPPTYTSQASSMMLYGALHTMLGDADGSESSGSRWMNVPRRSASAQNELHDVPEASPLPCDDDSLGRPGGGDAAATTAAAATGATMPLNKSLEIKLLPLSGFGVNTKWSHNRMQSSDYRVTNAARHYTAATGAVSRALGMVSSTSGMLLQPPPLQHPEAARHRGSLGNASAVSPRRTSFNKGGSCYIPTAVAAGASAGATGATMGINAQRKSMSPPSVSGRALSSAPPLPPSPSLPMSSSRLVCSQLPAAAGSMPHSTTPTALPPMFAAHLHSAGPYGTATPGLHSSVLQLDSSHSLPENPSVTARTPCLSALAWLQSSLACGGPGSLGIVVQELASGGSLRDLRFSLGPPGEPVQMRVLLHLARQVASGLAHLHSLRLVHGDLRAANVLLVPEPEGALGLRAMLCDYGYSRLLLTGQKTLQPRPHGAPTHLAPESWAETGPTRAADVFAFGVLLWELAAGYLPWSGLNMNQIMTNVVLEDLRPPMPDWLPRGYVQLVQACWSRRPQSRPDVAGVRQWLDELLMELPPSPPLSSRLPGADLRSPGSMVLLPYTDGGTTVAASGSDGGAKGPTAAAVRMAGNAMDLLVAPKQPQPPQCRETAGSRGRQGFGTAPGCRTVAELLLLRYGRAAASGIRGRDAAAASPQQPSPTLDAVTMAAVAGGRDAELPPFVAIEM